jgi:Leucine-rich repeat (LRR) protein
LGPPEAPGELGRLGLYRVLGVLGQGGMGVVFHAEDSHLRRPVALKLLRPGAAADAPARERFLREARAAAGLEHEHIVPVYQAGEASGVPFLAMPLLAGESLEARLRRAGPLPAAEALRLGRQLARGLAHAHGRGVMHRDVKPANVWLEELADEPGAGGGPGWRARLLDFGLARAAGDVSLTATGAVLGTPAYMAPEQAEGQPTGPRSDLYSLGAVLYQACTGQPPFTGENALAILTALAIEEPRPVRELSPSVPAALADLVMELLAKDPAARPTSARAVADRLAAIERRPAAQPARPRRKGPLAATVLLALLTTAYLFGGPAVRFLTNQGKEVGTTRLNPDVTPTAPGRPTERPPPVAPTTAPTTDRDREAAAWVLSLGNWVLIRVGDAERWVGGAPRDLPAGPFQLVGANLWANPRVHDAWLVNFRGLAHLRTLTLLAVPVGDAGVAHLRDLPALTELNLAFTRVTDAGLEHLRGLTNLTELSLTETRVTDAGLEHLAGLPNLALLRLSGTRVTDRGLTCLRRLPTLTELWLEGTMVTDAGLDHVQGVPRLMRLMVGRTQVTGAGLGRLRGLTQLRAFGLDTTQLTDSGLEQLRARPNLTGLILNGANADDLPRLTGLRTLQRLDLVLSTVGDADLGHLQAFPDLRRVNLVGTGVTDAGLDQLRGLPRLTHLNLTASRVTARGVARFREARPRHRVEWDPGFWDFAADRQVAESVLALGGTAQVSLFEVVRDVRRPEDLPRGGYSLYAVHLAGRPLTDADLARLAPRIPWHVDLAETAVGDAGLAHLRGSVWLATLDLSRTKVTDAGLEHVATLVNLGELSLAGTAVTDTGLAHLRGLVRLRELDLTGTRVTEAGAAALRQALPNCRIRNGPPN